MTDKRTRSNTSDFTKSQLNVSKRNRLGQHPSTSHQVEHNTVPPLMDFNASRNNGNPTTMQGQGQQRNPSLADQNVIENHGIPQPQHTPEAPESNEVETEDLERQDPFEAELPAHLLPYYKPARRSTLSHARLVERKIFYEYCRNNNITPLDLTYRPIKCGVDDSVAQAN